MLAYRITLSKFAGNNLTSSGRAARWNPNDVKMIYTASSRSLACLENAVHRSQAGFNQLFSILSIEFPDRLETATIHLNDLPADWADFDQMQLTQSIGEKWIKDNTTAVLKVPSSIINEEANYLLNPEHIDFKLIKVVNIQPFIFDNRIKR